MIIVWIILEVVVVGHLVVGFLYMCEAIVREKTAMLLLAAPKARGGQKAAIAEIDRVPRQTCASSSRSFWDS